MKKNKKAIGTAIVGVKGQIVIPANIREMFGIETGDTVVLLADQKRGIAIVKGEFVAQITEEELNKWITF